MAILAVVDRKNKRFDELQATAERRFDELEVMYGLRVAEAEHARKRLDQIRAERDEWKAKAERGELTIASLRDTIDKLETERRTLRTMLHKRGVSPDAG
jgi:chromosome segregation ATPase